MIGPIDGEASQEIWVDLVLGIGDGGAGPAVDGMYAHDLHEPGDVAPAHSVSPPTQFVHYPAAAVEGPGQVDLVYVPHHLEVTLRKRFLLVVEGRPCKLEQAALPGEWQGMLGRDHLFALVP